jgi:hypothetical protein
MTRTLASVTLAPLTLMVLAVPLAAQDPQCNTAFPDATNACNAAVDAIKAFHPLAGMIVSGGNPVLGTSGALGGAGHLFVTPRVNVIKAALPDAVAANQSSVPSRFKGAVPAPVVEAGLGLFKGTSKGLLAVDALGSAVLLPTGVVSDLSVDPDAPRVGSVALGIGYGVRVGVLQGSFPVPSLSVSWMHRTLPRLQYGTLGPAFGTGDDFEFDMNLRADNYRLVAGWKLAVIDLAAGLGIDHYTGDAHITFHDGATPTSVRTVAIKPNNTRQVLFVNGGLGLGPAKLVAELGFQTGKDQKLSTNFSVIDPTAGHVFGGVGFRFGF